MLSAISNLLSGARSALQRVQEPVENLRDQYEKKHAEQVQLFSARAPVGDVLKVVSEFIDARGAAWRSATRRNPRDNGDWRGEGRSPRQCLWRAAGNVTRRAQRPGPLRCPVCARAEPALTRRLFSRARSNFLFRRNSDSVERIA
jgi:hypothetical protein